MAPASQKVTPASSLSYGMSGTTTMPSTRTLVIVLAGGAGGRLELLTEQRAKPAVPFAGTHRLIDFPLSNCHNAGLSDVWVAQQFNPISLSDHLSNGRPWDLDRTTGGLLLLQPRLGNDGREGFHRGTADALWRNAPLIREFAPQALVVLSADAVYVQDYAALVPKHVASDAGVSIVTTEVDPEDAGRYGVVEVQDETVRDYAYKPDEPAGNLIANEVFVFTPAPLLEGLERLADDAGDDDLEDLGHGLLPLLVDRGEARASRFDGYWRDVGTVEAYWSSHQELLADPPPIDLGDPAWPVLTRSDGRAPPACCAARASTRASSPPGPASRGRSSARSSGAARSSRTARWCASRWCFRAPWCARAPRSCAPSSTTASRCARAPASARPMARSRWSG